jgi:hypothetical protein
MPPSSLTTKRTHAKVQNDFAGRETTMILIRTRTLIGQYAVTGPRPAADLTILAQIAKGTGLDDPFVFHVIVHDHDKLPDIASVKGNAVLPRTLVATPVHCWY